MGKKLASNEIRAMSAASTANSPASAEATIFKSFQCI